MSKILVVAVFFLIFSESLFDFADSGNSQPCNNDNVCLSIEHAGLKALDKETIESNVWAGVTAIAKLMKIDNLRIRVVDNSKLIIPEIGIGGYNPNEHEVIIAVDTSFVDLTETLKKELVPMLAHEIHHAKRRRSVGYGNTLLEAIVSEGLADHFSIEVTHCSPPRWSLALSEVELKNWINAASNSWKQSSYNHSEWFFGSSPKIPRWTGYAIGFELVKEYLKEHPDKGPSKLYNISANSFLP